MMRLVACEARKLLHARSLLALAASALVLAGFTIASPATDFGGPMFMMAGPAPDTIGGAVGFIGNIIDPQRVAASAVRTSFVYTVLWLPVVIVFATASFSADFASGSLRVSVARGISPARALGAKALVLCVAVGAGYALCCTASFLFKASQYGAAPSAADLGLFFGALGVNAVLLWALVAQAMLLFALTRSTFASALGLLALQVYVLLGYASAYGTSGAEPALNLLFAASPVFYLMHSCALCLGDVSLLASACYGAVATALCLAAAACALRVREV